jgi:AbrB family looped-hinge helix DNA binding protein
MTNPLFYKSRLRPKGQITMPVEIRSMLRVDEGDDLLFYLDDQGRVIIERAQVIPPDQAWFWTERWQRLERAAQAEIDAGKTVKFDDIDSALAYLEQLPTQSDAED